MAEFGPLKSSRGLSCLAILNVTSSHLSIPTSPLVFSSREATSRFAQEWPMGRGRGGGERRTGVQQFRAEVLLPALSQRAGTLGDRDEMRQEEEAEEAWRRHRKLARVKRGRPADRRPVSLPPQTAPHPSRSQTHSTILLHRRHASGCAVGLPASLYVPILIRTLCICDLQIFH